MGLRNDHCPTCDAPMREYRHPLALRSMMRVVERMYAQAGTSVVHVNTLHGLSITDAATGNWMKAAYWSLISTEVKRSGNWSVTEMGVEFLENRLGLSPIAVVYRNRVVRFEGDPVLHRDLAYRRPKRREDYLADASPHAVA